MQPNNSMPPSPQTPQIIVGGGSFGPNGDGFRHKIAVLLKSRRNLVILGASGIVAIALLSTALFAWAHYAHMAHDATTTGHGKTAKQKTPATQEQKSADPTSKDPPTTPPPDTPKAGTQNSGGGTSGTGSGSSGSGSTGSSGGSSSGGGGGTTPTSWPDASNTGYQHAPGYPGSLTDCSSTTIQSNHTYNFCYFPGGVDVGALGAEVSNVTFFGCRFQASGDVIVRLYGDNITFNYTTFEPGNGPGSLSPPISNAQGYQYGISADGSYYTQVAQLTVTHSNFWGFAEAIDTNGSTQAKPQVFRDNYLHDSRNDGGSDHTDGIGTLSGNGTSSYTVIDHNNIQTKANTNAIAFQGGTYSHMTITNNLLGGFGYTVSIISSNHAPYTTFTGNTFSTLIKPDWGPLYGDDFVTSTGSVWSNNKWLVPSGAAWGNPAHSGWYWLPTAGAQGTSDDGPYVSQTDY